MHFVARHGSKIEKEPEHFLRVVPVFIYVRGSITANITCLDLVFYPAYLRPHVKRFDSVVANPVWDAIDSNIIIGDVRIEEVFSVPVTCCVG